MSRMGDGISIREGDAAAGEHFGIRNLDSPFVRYTFLPKIRFHNPFHKFSLLVCLTGTLAVFTYL